MYSTGLRLVPELDIQVQAKHAAERHACLNNQQNHLKYFGEKNNQRIISLPLLE